MHNVEKKVSKNGKRRKVKASKVNNSGLLVLETNSDAYKLSEKECKSKKHYFVPQEYKKCSHDEKEEHNLNVLQVIDTKDGCKLVDEFKNPIFILIPRKEVLFAKKKNSLFTQTKMMQDLITSNVHIKRSDARKGVAIKEISVGIKANRAGHGYLSSAIKEKNPQLWNQVIRYTKQTEHVTKAYISEEWMVGIKKAQDVVGWETLKSTSLWSAISCSCNYYSAAHIDDDFFLSAFQVVADVGEVDYEFDSPVVTHFCFPTNGYAVAVRNGDVHLFNPTVYHCCSKKEKSFEKNNVYLNSFYLKTNIVGLNDNRIQFNV